MAQVALDVGIIDGKVFVALVFMAIVTSIIPGPLIRHILKRPTTTSVSSIIPSTGFRPFAKPKTMQDAIRDLAGALGHAELAGVAIEREISKADNIWDGLAIPSAISKDIKKPLAALAIMQDELKWGPNCADDNLVRFVVLLLVPESKITLEFDLTREVVTLFSNPTFRAEIVEVQNIVEMRALFQIERYRQGASGHNANPIPVIALKDTGMLAVDVNEIINGSPRASPPQTDVLLSPMAINILQPRPSGLEAIDAPFGVNQGDTMVEFKRRPSRRETSKSIRATIEEYVGPLPENDSNPENGFAAIQGGMMHGSTNDTDSSPDTKSPSAHSEMAASIDGLSMLGSASTTGQLNNQEDGAPKNGQVHVEDNTTKNDQLHLT